jgi:hypothetical protein
MGSGADREFVLCDSCGAEKYEDQVCPWCRIKINPLNKQEGGSHYKDMIIQPMEYSMANKLDACQHTIVKYVSRFRTKNGIEDLKKAIHCIEMLMEFEYGKSKRYNR